VPLIAGCGRYYFAGGCLCPCLMNKRTRPTERENGKNRTAPGRGAGALEPGRPGAADGHKCMRVHVQHDGAADESGTTGCWKRYSWGAGEAVTPRR